MPETGKVCLCEILFEFRVVGFGGLCYNNGNEIERRRVL